MYYNNNNKTALKNMFYRVASLQLYRKCVHSN